jgi:outer membrane lipopolysaccharide assembly protein LptE/RlpB
MRPALGLLLAGLAAGGCGYAIRGNLPAHIKTVSVPVFVNKTTEPGVEDFITRAVVEAFTTNSGLRVVSPERADAILEGEIVGYQLQPLAYNQAANVQQYRLIVTLNLRFRDVREGKPLLEEKGVQEKADFQSASSVAANIAVERGPALQQAATDIGRAIVNLAVERF